MDISGEYRLKSSAKDLRRRFADPSLLKEVMPTCTAMETIEPNTFIASVQRIGRPDEKIQYLFRFIPGETENEFVLHWSGTEPEALISFGKHNITLTKDNAQTTILRHHSTVQLTEKGQKSISDPGAVIALVNQLFDNVADLLQKEDNRVKKNSPDFDDVLHEAEDPILELEHEAEEAAATGFLGGAQMWGWIALAIFILILLIFFR